MKYKKDFDTWNIRKKKLNITEQEDFFYEREIWWCSIGVNVGSEQDGKNELFERPIIIIKKFSKDLVWAIPLTRSSGNPKYTYCLEKDSFVVLSQLKTLSSKRLLRKIGKIRKFTYYKILLRVIIILIR